MSCLYPVGTYRKDGSPCMRPCGYCIQCRLDRSREWATRCIHEAQLHEENSFITLTYNNENIPEDRNISKEEMQNFVKNLRREVYPKQIRFFGCGEYGEKFGRPHYHLCIFGHDFGDKEMVRANLQRSKKRFSRKTDNPLYHSKTLEKVWKKGYSSIGELTFESAGYVARYVTKKINGKKFEEHYKGKTPEFALMSRRPGIGNEWIKKYLYSVYPKDFLTINGKKVRPPRYYDTMLEKINPEMWNHVKEKRIEKEEKSKKDDNWRNYGKQKYIECVTKKGLQRRLENV